MYANVINVRNCFVQFAPVYFCSKKVELYKKLFISTRVSTVKILLTFNMPYGVYEIDRPGTVVFGLSPPWVRNILLLTHPTLHGAKKNARSSVAANVVVERLSLLPVW
jgi:hypothetical protein